MTLSLRGAITAIVTPFKGGEVDFDRLREQVQFQLDEGIDGLVPVGTTGESPTLTMAEHKRVIEATVEAVGGRVPVIAGAGGNSTAEAKELHKFAKGVGVDAVLSVNPYYNKPTQDGLYAHFMALSEAVDVPIVLYNIPGRTGVTMSPETVGRLYRDGNIAAMKEATGDVSMATRYLQECDVTVLSGDDPLTLPMMSVGAKGVISVLSNVMPAKVAQLCTLVEAGDFASAAKLHHEVFKLTASLFLDGNPVGVKHAMHQLGRDTGELRLPLVPASDATKQTINTHLKTVGLL